MPRTRLSDGNASTDHFTLLFGVSCAVGAMKRRISFCTVPTLPTTYAGYDSSMNAIGISFGEISRSGWLSLLKTSGSDETSAPSVCRRVLRFNSISGLLMSATLPASYKKDLLSNVQLSAPYDG